MKRPRLDLGLDASRATLNESECARLAELLSARRRSRGLSIQDVGARLLLASAQVSALESVRADAFYSAEFYATALRKYAALMGLDAAELDRILVRPEPPASAPVFKRGRPSLGVSLARVPRPSTRVMLGAGLLVTAVAGGLLVAAVRERAAAKPAPSTSGNTGTPATPLEPVPPSVPAPAAEPATGEPDAVASAADAVTPAMIPVSTSPQGSVGRVKVGQRTWVFVRFAGGSTLERTLGGGEELVLTNVPTYIAVGTADDTSIDIGGQPLDTSRFTVNGQLRVGSSQLARLVASR